MPHKSAKLEIGEIVTNVSACNSPSLDSRVEKLKVVDDGHDQEDSTYARYHETLFTNGMSAPGSCSAASEALKTTPIFTGPVLRAAKQSGVASPTIFPQYGMLARLDPDERVRDTDFDDANNGSWSACGLDLPTDRRLFVNMNAPWSAFICGSQGSGKSHTLSCLLEAALMKTKLGPLPHPLHGLVLHYDKFTGSTRSQPCEAANLVSSGIPVRVLVSPTSYHRLKKIYENLPGLATGDRRPQVLPFLLETEHLSIENMLKLMAVDGETKSSLYMQIVHKILRSLALRRSEGGAIDYAQFRTRLEAEDFNPAQSALLSMRLGLLESFMRETSEFTRVIHSKPTKYQRDREKLARARRSEDQRDQTIRANMGGQFDWEFEPGTLTIVDLSCPFVDESAACTLFDIALALFLNGDNEEEDDDNSNEDGPIARPTMGKIVALDEAHKFMTSTSGANELTDTLISVIREQRHLGIRVIVATQEPTISPVLLDLCTMTIVHRFTSPSWMKTLQGHLAAASRRSEGDDGQGTLFDRIVDLEVGHALIFAPSAVVGPLVSSGVRGLTWLKLGSEYLHVEVRNRLTVDGGRSVLAAAE